MRLALLVTAMLSTIGCSPIVGATCAPGRCGVGTIDGGAGDATLDAFGDGALADAGPFDGGPFDAGSFDAGTFDAGTFDAGTLDAETPDAGTLDAGAEDAGSDDAGRDDAGGSDAGVLDGGTDAGTDAGPVCIAPEVPCPSGCADLMTDPENCGACDVSCPSGLCELGICLGAPVGHLVLVGHDYETSRVAMRRLVGNAVFLARTAPVAVVAYEGASTAASRAGTDMAIDATAVALGRSWSRSVTTAAAIPAALATADVLLVYAQAGATDAELLSLRTSLATPLRDFLRGGGVVVVLETATASNAGTFQILEPSVFPATGVTELGRIALSVVAVGDPVALGMPGTYRAERTTIGFDGAGPTGHVVDEPGGRPVVLHWTVSP